MSSKWPLVEALKRFNRKERYWLISDALGKQNLDKRFLERLTAVLRNDSNFKAPIPPDAWWAMDYHLDWIAAVLAFPDFKVNATKGKNISADNPIPKGLFRKNQQDTDLIIAFEKTIILVEAKFDSYWNEKQLCNKLNRIKTINKKTAKNNSVAIFFVCLSPRGCSHKFKENSLTLPDGTFRSLELLYDNGHNDDFLVTSGSENIVTRPAPKPAKTK